MFGFMGPADSKPGSSACREDEHWRRQELAYRELRVVRELIPSWSSLTAVETFMGPLTRISAQDLAPESLDTFSAYRFLYERLLGAKSRPWLPAAFCGAAALPQILPARRKVLLSSISEGAATSLAWSEAEPGFFPKRMPEETDAEEASSKRANSKSLRPTGEQH